MPEGSKAGCAGGTGEKKEAAVKRRAGWTARLFAWLGGIFEPFADREGEDGKWDYGAIEM